MIPLKSKADRATPLHRAFHWLPGESFLWPRRFYMSNSLFNSGPILTALPITHAAPASLASPSHPPSTLHPAPFVCYSMARSVLPSEGHAAHSLTFFRSLFMFLLNKEPLVTPSKISASPTHFLSLLSSLYFSFFPFITI